MQPADTLTAGEVGYLITGLKDVARLRVGETLTSQSNPALRAARYCDVKPMVFAGLFPTDSDDYPELRDALERLKLNDASLSRTSPRPPRRSASLARASSGCCMEIVRERLEREFDLDLLVTAPTVAYRVETPTGELVEVHNPADMPDDRERVEEPYVRASIIVQGRRRPGDGATEPRALRPHGVPLARACAPALRAASGEIVFDYDQLKSRTRGYASFDYDYAGFREGELVRLDVLVGGEPVGCALPVLYREAAYSRGRLLVDRLREEIPRQMFDVPVQAAIGSRIIARETIRRQAQGRAREVLRRDITRKRKLLDRQKRGKKRMKQVGAVEVPQEAFLAVLNLDEGAKK